MSQDMFMLDNWELHSHQNVSWKVLESLVGPLQPLIDEGLFDTPSEDIKPEDNMEHSVFLEPPFGSENDVVETVGHHTVASLLSAPQQYPSEYQHAFEYQDDQLRAYAEQQGLDPAQEELEEQARLYGMLAAQAYFHQGAFGTTSMLQDIYMQQQLSIPYFQPEGWKTHGSWDSSGVGGNHACDSAQGFAPQAYVYGHHAHTPFPAGSYHGWGVQQEPQADRHTAQPQQLDLSVREMPHQQQRQQQPQRRQQMQQTTPAYVIQALRALGGSVPSAGFVFIPQVVPAPYCASVPGAGFASVPQIVPAPRHDDVATLLQPAESSIALVDMAFPKSETRSGSIEVAAAAPYAQGPGAAAAAFAQGPGMWLQEKVDVGVPVSGTKRQPGNTALAQHASRHGADQRVSATHVVTTAMGWPMQFP